MVQEPKQHSILIVDDDVRVRSVLVAWFERKNFSVETAENGKSAIVHCHKQTFDAVTLDLAMPEMDGNEAVRGIRAVQPLVPVIILTAYPDRISKEVATMVNRVIEKPTPLASVEEAVRAEIRHSAD